MNSFKSNGNVQKKEGGLDVMFNATNVSDNVKESNNPYLINDVTFFDTCQKSRNHYLVCKNQRTKAPANAHLISSTKMHIK